MTHTTARECLDCRRAGILLHISSLPGPGSCGDLGPEAYHFVDFLANSGFSVWQMLPVGTTQDGDSPYQSSSVHAGNPEFIALEPLIAAGWLDPDLAPAPGFDADQRATAIAAAWAQFSAHCDPGELSAFEAFCAEHAGWLEDFALFQALHDERNAAWWEWPATLRDRRPAALTQARKRLAEPMSLVRFQQFLFFRQWAELRRYAEARGVRLFGDMPIFVAHDSAEVWAQRGLFELDKKGRPTVVAGVPPDYFSATGQRWGNPLYRWDVMQDERFAFWVERLRTQLALFDIVRIDHFRGFEAYWEIPAQEPHAINGRWVSAPGEALFERLLAEFSGLNVVAEDLGVITPDVEALRDRYGLPGMKILQFAFSGDPSNPYLPFNHPQRCVVYTGTHDNDTTLGWYRSLDAPTREHVDSFLGHSREPMPWPLIRCALMSRAHLAVLPMQDVLDLGSEHRMNLPGTNEGNWQWRFSWEQVAGDLADRLRRKIQMYGRLPA